MNSSESKPELAPPPSSEVVVVPEEKKVKEVERRKVASSLRAIAGWIENVEYQLTEVDIHNIDVILSQHSKKTQIFLVASAHHALKKLIDLMSSADLVEDKIMRRIEEDVDDEISVEDLRRVLDSLHKRMEYYFKFITEMMEKNLPSAFNEQSGIPKLVHGSNGENVFDTSVKRERMRSIFDKFLLVAEPDPNPPAESPEEDVALDDLIAEIIEIK